MDETRTLPNRKQNYQPQWEPELLDKFMSCIDNEQIDNIISQLHTYPYSERVIEHITNQVNELFSLAANNTFVKSEPTHKHFNNKPWFGPDCHRARKHYHETRSKYRSRRNEENKRALNDASNNYKQKINYYVHKNKQNRIDKLRKLNTNNPKQYWKFIKSLKPKSSQIESPSVEEFYDFFKKVNTSDTTNQNNCDHLVGQLNENESLNGPITETEISDCIDKLSNSKAPSPSDCILNEYIKYTKSLLMPVYMKLFNIVLDTGFIPETWLEGHIIPIYKNKGDSKQPSNYRPITILSCLGKLFTSVLNQRISSFLESENILQENQAGFRNGYSCSDHIFTLHMLIDLLKKRKQKLYCAFIDFSQAFDKVWRYGLWQKLLKSSINGKVFNVIFNMYKNIKSRIVHLNSVSNFFKSDIGVRQGENLSPILFSIVLNDLQTHLEDNGGNGVELKDDNDSTLWLKLLILLYADDTIIVSTSENDFQSCLNSFNDYCNEWKLKVNLNKTKVIVFGSRNKAFQFQLNGHLLEITDQYHYLGVTFSKNGSFLKARKHNVQQANKAMHLLYTRTNNADLPIDLTLKLFDHTILPILTYGSEVFGFENIDIIDKVHNDFLRKITKARKSTPIYMLYGELGRYPISITVKTRMISYWNRLMLGKESKLAFKIYTHILNQTNYESKWIYKIINILDSVGKSNIWLYQPNYNHVNLHKQVKQILIDQYRQTWSSQLEQSNKGLIYKIYKQSPDLEYYFKVLNDNDYLTLFKYRTANHRLPIESGRWDGTLITDRKCNLCDSEDIGSERHYLLSCSFFKHSRDLYLSDIETTDSEDCFSSLLQSKSTDVMKNVCKLIRDILKHF